MIRAILLLLALGTSQVLAQEDLMMRGKAATNVIMMYLFYDDDCAKLPVAMKQRLDALMQDRDWREVNQALGHHIKDSMEIGRAKWCDMIAPLVAEWARRNGAR